MAQLKTVVTDDISRYQTDSVLSPSPKMSQEYLHGWMSFPYKPFTPQPLRSAEYRLSVAHFFKSVYNFYSLSEVTKNTRATNPEQQDVYQQNDTIEPRNYRIPFLELIINRNSCEQERSSGAVQRIIFSERFMTSIEFTHSHIIPKQVVS